MSQRDFLGAFVPLKYLLMATVGTLTYPGFALLNRLHIRGGEHLLSLPDRGVLFVSNHQTYFTDVIALYHIFAAVRNGHRESLGNPLYLFNLKVNVYYVAAEETMRSGTIPRLLAYSGAVMTRRVWREGARDVSRTARLPDYASIGHAIDAGWVITFPQGTTTPFAKGRRGVCHIIRQFRPIVIPVVIDGFAKVFRKKGLIFRKVGHDLTVRFKPPISFSDPTNADSMLQEIMTAIEQV
ncbi:MAG: 1-acyl-sn-glycerol-3-phosphate acyltransferase [candidate division Zixibacteria bacterium]|nr:1-acyl-sn-glycerol-3-phosphate acyltransferase [candidate division Zixibacteria bacterium]